MMKTSGLITLLLLASFVAKADIIEVPHLVGGAALSLEGAAGLEKPFTKRNSAAILGILGAVSMVQDITTPATKGQLTVEVKHYFEKHSFSGFNIGLSAGLNYMRYPEFWRVVTYDHVVGFVPGLKLSYVKKLNASFQLEPYVEASTPWYSRSLADVFGDTFHNYNTFMLTVGVRVGFNKLLKYESKE